MTKFRTLMLAGLAALLPLQALAEPVTLKLSFFGPDTEVNYAKAIKPLEDAILIDAKDRRVLALLARYGAAHARDIAKTDPGQAYKQIVSAGVYLRMLQREHPDATPEEKQLLLDVLYDEAAAHAKSMRMEETLGALREAVGAGFRDFDKIRGDADWKEMLEYPEFKKEFDEIAKTQKPS